LPHCPPELARADLAACASFDARPWLAEIAAPALVVFGTCDLLLQPRRAAELALGLPHARLLPIADTGHFPFLERPDAFHDAVASWLL
jgi:pimeloyl-ACP methyl ester carboxylesterase